MRRIVQLQLLLLLLLVVPAVAGSAGDAAAHPVGDRSGAELSSASPCPPPVFQASAGARTPTPSVHRLRHPGRDLASPGFPRADAGRLPILHRGAVAASLARYLDYRAADALARAGVPSWRATAPPPFRPV